MNAIAWSNWWVVILIGLITLGYRLSFILFADRLTLPPALRRALRFVPIAALTAIIVPEILLSNGGLNLSFSNMRLIAGLVAIAVAWRTKNVLLTILLGMGTLWVLQWLVVRSA